MSLPRAIIPGRCYLIPRRCSERPEPSSFVELPNPDDMLAGGYVASLALSARSWVGVDYNKCE